MLSDREWSQILAASWSLGGIRSEDELEAAAMQVVFDVIGGDEAVFNAADLDTQSVTGKSFPDIDLERTLTPLLASVLADHPIVTRLAASSSVARPLILSNLLPFHQFERTETYQVLFKPREMRYQAVIPLRMADNNRAGLVYAVNRSRRNFGEAELPRLMALQPVLAAHHAARQARQPSEVQRDELRGRLGLTPREIEILGLIAAGLTAVSIGHRLQISPRTVRTHVGNIYEKLDIHDRVAAVNYCRGVGLVP